MESKLESTIWLEYRDYGSLMVMVSNSWLACHGPWAPRVLPPLRNAGEYVTPLKCRHFKTLCSSVTNSLPTMRVQLFSQQSSSPRLIEDKTFNDSDIINNLIDYEDGQEPDSLRADKIM
ncbi:uncharacterized protein TNCV_4382561 [Trichonephila clavipes]|nr:uncharacterized protein TNCV_4382561 [Trichonephila clavipes]